jgi:long-subunit acyl-CoA synthetase (AMP-forming)
MMIGIEVLKLCPVTNHDGEKWRFMCIFSKNREEWAITDLACMMTSITIVPPFENLGDQGLQYILN